MNTGTEHASTPKPRPEDIASPDAIVKALYDCISGPAGKRNWYRFRSLFIDGARLIPTGERAAGEGGFKIMDVETWIAEAGPWLEENDFWETELQRHSDRFGNIIQAFSTYESRERKDGPVIARGINSIQLLHREGRWWVVTVMWDNESKDNPLPGEFLPHLW